MQTLSNTVRRAATFAAKDVRYLRCALSALRAVRTAAVFVISFLSANWRVVSAGCGMTSNRDGSCAILVSLFLPATAGLRTRFSATCCWRPFCLPCWARFLYRYASRGAPFPCLISSGRVSQGRFELHFCPPCCCCPTMHRCRTRDVGRRRTRCFAFIPPSTFVYYGSRAHWRTHASCRSSPPSRCPLCSVWCVGRWLACLYPANLPAGGGCAFLLYSVRFAFTFCWERALFVPCARRPHLWFCGRRERLRYWR